MTNILLEGYGIDEPWLYDELKNYIKPEHLVAVAALAFRDSRVKSEQDWETLYGKEHGKYYNGIVNGLKSYGIAEEKISFINYFTDTKASAAQKIKDADVIYFLGGLPDRMMERINELELYDSIINHCGIVMGYSAGAVVQLEEYHLTPDEDYPEFGYYKGFPFVKDFYMEVHYENSDQQNESIKRIITEKNKPVYATAVRAGSIIVHGGKIKTIGDVKIFTSAED